MSGPEAGRCKFRSGWIYSADSIRTKIGESCMRVGILGSGLMGGKLGTIFALAGHEVVLTCSLPMNDDNTELVVAHTSSGAEELAKMIPKARVVAAFQTVPSEVLFGVYGAKRKTRRPSLVYCG